MSRDLMDGLITQAQANQEIEDTVEVLKESLQAVINELLETYSQKQEETGKGELEYISVRLLLTSVPFKMPLYRVDFFDESCQLDLIEHTSYWDISPVGDIIYTDIFTGGNPYRKLSTKENYLNEQNWFLNIRVFNKVFKEYSNDMVSDILRNLGIENINSITEKYF